jgi:hypothetical protein
MINLIWQTKDGDETQFEYQYITEYVFKDIQYNKYFDNKSYSTVLDNSVIIYSSNTNIIEKNFNDYLSRFDSLKFRYYLLHLSNENLNHEAEYYSKAHRVYRQYYDSTLNKDNVVFIPLGFKSGYLNKNINNSFVKLYDFIFVGQIKSDREELCNILKNYKSFIHNTYSWNCISSLSPDNCSKAYSETKFAPCPMGWVNPDSFRIMESLEHNCIPILKSYYNNFDYHTKVWGDTPIPRVESWQELEKFNKLSDIEYQKLHKSVFDWYTEYKSNFSKLIKSTL